MLVTVIRVVPAISVASVVHNSIVVLRDRRPDESTDQRLVRRKRVPDDDRDKTTTSQREVSLKTQ